MTLIQNKYFKKDSKLIFILNTFVYIFFFVCGYIGILRVYYSGIILNLLMGYSLRQSKFSLYYFMGLEMDIFSLLLFYFSVLIICVINLITLIKYIIIKCSIEKYYIGNCSQLIFLPLLFFACLNFLEYPKLKDDSESDDELTTKKKLGISLGICIIGLIILCIIYFLSFIKKNEEINEENPNYSLKIFYEVLLIFYLYYFFHLIQLFRIKDKLKDYVGDVPKKFQIVMASIIETVFGLIGLVIIFFGKAFAYAFYQIFIYVAFLIIRADIKKIDDEPYYVKIKLNVYDYIISSIMIILTIVCVIFLILLMRKM